MACNCEEAACPRWEHLRQQREEFYQKLEPYPHLFKLSGYDDISINVYRSIRDRLEAERGQRGTATVMERSRDANLIAFASFQLKDYRSAMTETDSVLEEDGSNLVASADKAIFLWLEGRKDEAEKQLDRLRHWRNQPGFRDKETEGKAEMAYCYSRMGPCFNHLAVQMFEEVVSTKPEMMDWKLGLAMSLRRSTLVNLRLFHNASVDTTMETTERAVELFLEVKNSDASDLTKAQAAAELGLFISNHSVHPKCLHDEHPITASQCFEQAKRLAPNDVSILNKSGTYYSFNQNLPEARRCLELSIRIMPTAQAHEELGAVFQNLAEEERKAKAAQQFGPTRRRLTPDDEYVQKALQHYGKAIDLSHGEHTTALRKRGYLLKKNRQRRTSLW